ncbi:MAG: hypothetical protein DRJ03_04745 [Chloroflexi bacterium]|nr:MAG: hypothetical protein DRJ03_04745 [Chloroflexota bacterium]
MNLNYYWDQVKQDKAIKEGEFIDLSEKQEKELAQVEQIICDCCPPIQEKPCTTHGTCIKCWSYFIAHNINNPKIRRFQR